MKNLVTAVAAIAAFGFINTASAADMPVKAVKAPVATPYNWAGWYVGGNIGYGWGVRSNPDVSVNDPGGTVGYNVLFAAGGNVMPSVKPKGLIGGGQIGVNWVVAPSWVAGLVADFQDSGLKDSQTNSVQPPLFNLSNQTNSVNINWFGTVRGKLGFAQNNWLLYATGGLAYGQVKSSGSFVFPTVVGATFAGSTSTTKVGWTAGAGLNYGLTPNWIVGLEYLYVDLGRVSYADTGPLAPASALTVSNRAAAHIARVTLDYKF